MSEVPTGWVKAKIGAIARIETGSTPPKNNASHYGREICFFKPGDLDSGGLLEFSEDMVTTKGAAAGRLLPPNTVLVTCIGNLGKSGIISTPSICNQQINAILPTPVASPWFIYYWSRTIGSWLEENSSATTISIINKGRFSQAPISIPPLPEQRRIVAKLDSLTGRTARAREELGRIPRLVEKYREAILAAEFDEGHTSAWESGIFEKRVAEGLIGLVRAKSQQDHTVGIPYIRMNHYDLDGRWNFDGLTCVATTPAEVDRFSLQPNDVLFNTRNSVELVGKVAIWKGEPNKFVYNNNLLRLRFRRGVVPAFAALYMMSSPFRHFLETVKSATTSVAAIYQRSLYSAPFPIPSVAAQRQIVHRIETAFTWFDRVVAEHANASRLLPKLDQAILAKAFRGELVLSDGPPRPLADGERA